MDARAQSGGDLVRRLSHARERAFGRIAPGPLDAEEFALGNDVKTGTLPTQQIEHGQIRIGLHGIANEVIEGLERRIKPPEIPADCLRRVNISRRPGLVRQFLQIHALTVENAVVIRK